MSAVPTPRAAVVADRAWDEILKIARWMAQQYVMPEDFVPALERLRASVAVMPPGEAYRRLNVLQDLFTRSGKAIIAGDRPTAERRLHELYRALLTDTN